LYTSLATSSPKVCSKSHGTILADTPASLHRHVAEEKADLEQQMTALKAETHQEYIRLQHEVEMLSRSLQAAESVAEAGTSLPHRSSFSVKCRC